MAVSAQRKPEFPVPDSIHAFRIANVIQTVTEIDSKTTKKTMPYVYCFDSFGNISHYLDEKGLYLAYEYDSLNNLTTEYFFEESDSSQKRIPSGKWNYIYEDGLMTRVDEYTFDDGKWVLDEVLKNSYRKDKYGRVTEVKFYSDNELKATTTYTYSSKPSENQKKYDFNSGWLNNTSCTREVTKNASGKTTEIITYVYDSKGNCIKKTSEDLSDKSIKRTKEINVSYSSTGLVLQEIVFIIVDSYGADEYSHKYTYEYDTKGFVTKYISNHEGRSETVKVYDYLDQ